MCTVDRAQRPVPAVQWRQWCRPWGVPGDVLGGVHGGVHLSQVELGQKLRKVSLIGVEKSKS